MYQIEFYRPRETFADFTMRCREHAVEVTYRPGFQYGLGMLCRELVAKGLPDGALHIIEVGVKPEVRLEQRLDSMHRIAELPVDMTAPKPVVDEDTSEAAEPETASTTISPAIKAALAALLASPDAWGTLPGRTKGMLGARDFVVVESKARATVTDEGRIAHDTFEVVAPISFVTAAKAKDGVFKVEKEPRETGPLITARQRDAFEIVVRRSGGWDDLHGKTKNFMVNAGWVRIDNGVPALTDDGQKIAETLGL